MPTVGVRCNPVLFELREGSPEPLVKLPYRMVLAVLSTNAIMIYDTQHSHMLSIVRNQHCANLTDVAWSNDGATLFVTSSDGFCSIIEFAENELGIPCSRAAYPASMTEREIQPWFALRAQERGTGKKHIISESVASVPAAVNKSGTSKKRRVALVAVSQTEAGQGNLLE
jgi:hypothetical protein